MLSFVFINGRPGSGKDTQANLIRESNPSALRLSTGDIVRGADSQVGEYARFHSVFAPYQADSKKGGLIPDDVMLSVVNTVVEEHLANGADTFIFTGYPRTEGQLKAVDTYLKSLGERGEDVNARFICFSVLEHHSIARAETRRNQAIAFGEDIRPDDDPKTVDRRLKEYKDHTLPMLRVLAAERRLDIIKSNGTIENVRGRTENAFASTMVLERR